MSSEKQGNAIPEFLEEHQEENIKENTENLQGDHLSILKDSLDKMVTLKDIHKKNKETNARVWAEYTKYESLAMGILKEHKLPSFSNVTHKISIKVESSVLTPKTTKDKQLLFDWIDTNKGNDVLMGYLSINSRSLNSFYNVEKKLHQDKTGEIDFQMAGVEMGASMEKLSMRKLTVKK